MPKLQSVKRTNGTMVYFVYIPAEFISELCWNKSDKIEITKSSNKLVLCNDKNIED